MFFDFFIKTQNFANNLILSEWEAISKWGDVAPKTSESIDIPEILKNSNKKLVAPKKLRLGSGRSFGI